ncbi:MAG: hypothetical protein WDO15_14840 [Bacteroidota bacterium]
MFRKILLMIAIGMLVLVMIDCKKDGTPEPSDKDKQLQALSFTWTCTVANKDGVVQTGYDNFKITISGTPGNNTFGYVCNGRPAMSPWPSSGTFTFSEQTAATDLTRQDGLAVHYTVVGNTFEVTFDYNGEGFSGRVSEIPGVWVFRFTRN